MYVQAYITMLQELSSSICQKSHKNRIFAMSILYIPIFHILEREMGLHSVLQMTIVLRNGRVHTTRVLHHGTLHSRWGNCLGYRMSSLHSPRQTTPLHEQGPCPGPQSSQLGRHPRKQARERGGPGLCGEVSREGCQHEVGSRSAPGLSVVGGDEGGGMQATATWIIKLDYIIH